MKHEKPPGRWRLKKTLARKTGFRPIEAEDIRYAYAAYKAGSLKDMAGRFAEPGMTPKEFDAEFQAAVLTRYHGAWTLFAETKRGYLPVGMVLAFYSHADPALSPFMIVGDLPWFPWASARNKLEAAVRFFADIRATIPMVDYAYGPVNQRFFETLMFHGVMRRIGTTYNVVKGEAVQIFETRAR